MTGFDHFNMKSSSVLATLMISVQFDFHADVELCMNSFYNRGAWS